MYINEAMASPPKTCGLESTLDELAHLMWSGDCGAIPVVDAAGKPLGIVTDRDIAMAAMLNHRPLWELQAATVIKDQKPVCCSQQDTVEQGVARMEQGGVRRVLVTDEAGTLVGILSMGDALALVQSPMSGKKKSGVSIDHVLGMLQKVSAHHGQSSHLPVNVS